ncbi:MAG: 4-hydroxy-tetrahydrodipicolinate reductase [Patescibacteria group bacterium]|jgi:4-hydroxy-tetrahydrodipicolinate reductase
MSADKNNLIRAAVAGIGGRMGSRIAQLLGESEGMELTAGFESPESVKAGKDLSEIIGGALTGKLTAGDIKEVIADCDVIIDFTNAEASLKHLKAAAEHGKSIVIGSTGFTNDQLKEAGELAKKIPVVIAPNMSLGVNVLFKLAAEAAKLLGGEYDVEIIEAHHRFKKDAPSGTAMKLAEVLAGALGRDLEKVGKYARHGLIGERTKNEIGIQSVRAGDIVGDHTIIFGGLGERLELTHRAGSRDTFARGAIRAAKWIVGKPPGFYDMRDVLGMK